MAKEALRCILTYWPKMDHRDRERGEKKNTRSWARCHCINCNIVQTEVPLRDCASNINAVYLHTAQTQPLLERKAWLAVDAWRDANFIGRDGVLAVP